MTEREFIAYNERLKQRQAVIKTAKEKNRPVRIGEILPDVLADIQRRSMQREYSGGACR